MGIWTRRYLDIPPERLPARAALLRGDSLLIGCANEYTSGIEGPSYGYLWRAGQTIATAPEGCVGFAGVIAWGDALWAMCWIDAQSEAPPTGSTFLRDLRLYEFDLNTWHQRAVLIEGVGFGQYSLPHLGRMVSLPHGLGLEIYPRDWAPDSGRRWLWSGYLTDYGPEFPEPAPWVEWRGRTWAVEQPPETPIPDRKRCPYIGHTPTPTGQVTRVVKVQVPVGVLYYISPWQGATGGGVMAWAQMEDVADWTYLQEAAVFVPWPSTFTPTLRTMAYTYSRFFPRVTFWGTQIVQDDLDYRPTNLFSAGGRLWMIGVTTKDTILEFTGGDLRVGRIVFEGIAPPKASKPQVGRITFEGSTGAGTETRRVGRITFVGSDGTGTELPRLGMIRFEAEEAGRSRESTIPRIGRIVFEGLAPPKAPNPQVGRITFEGSTGAGTETPRVGRITFVGSDGTGMELPRLGMIRFEAEEAERSRESATPRLGRVTIEAQDGIVPPGEGDKILWLRPDVPPMTGDTVCFGVRVVASLSAEDAARCRVLVRADAEGAPVDAWNSYQEVRLGENAYLERPGLSVRVGVIAPADLPDDTTFHVTLPREHEQEDI